MKKERKGGKKEREKEKKGNERDLSLSLFLSWLVSVGLCLALLGSVGLCCAVMGAVGGKADFRHVAVGVIPFIVFDLCVLGLLITFPELATWLPKQMIDG